MPSSLAPIVLFVYNRPSHTRQTLEALTQNELAHQSELYIFSDGAKSNANPSDIENIIQVRNVIREKKWCGTVHIHERKENQGLSKSIIEGVTQVVNTHERVIVLEDDVITSPYFLTFCNEGLNFYNDDVTVYGVSGFSFANDVMPCESYFLPMISSWGWATWKDRWSSLRTDAKNMYDELVESNRLLEFNFGGYDFTGILKNEILKIIDSWDICFYTSVFLKHGKFLYPKGTLVQNIGFDGLGVHYNKKTDSPFVQPLFHQPVQVTSIDPAENIKVEKIIRREFQLKFKKKNLIDRLKNRISLLLKNILD